MRRILRRGGGEKRRGGFRSAGKDGFLMEDLKGLQLSSAAFSWGRVISVHGKNGSAKTALSISPLFSK